jgi:hypothetical protein
VARELFKRQLEARRIAITRNQRDIDDPRRWVGRYRTWWNNSNTQPDPIIVDNSEDWTVDMPPVPDDGVVPYLNVEAVALNIEGLVQEIYTKIDQAAPLDPTGLQLRQTLAALEDTAENYYDAVQANSDYSETLYDLFNLDMATQNAEHALQGYPEQPLVATRMATLRYYVNVLLYTYRQTN